MTPSTDFATACARMASGAVIARNTGRELVTVWHRDEHCRAALHDLLAYDGPVIDGEAGALMRARAARSL
ncbi:hypothetical protein OKA06_19175 [Novosphingobium sp. MW5]|nr:hypothetical protein [Novosphingobium sp. MW5]